MCRYNFSSAGTASQVSSHCSLECTKCGHKAIHFSRNPKIINTTQAITLHHPEVRPLPPFKWSLRNLLDVFVILLDLWGIFTVYNLCPNNHFSNIVKILFFCLRPFHVTLPGLLFKNCDVLCRERVREKDFANLSY